VRKFAAAAFLNRRACDDELRAIAGVKTSYFLSPARVRLILFCGFDELHGYKTWDILEAMQGDPTRTDVMIWITSYASLYHKPDVRLCNLFAQGKRLSPN